MPAPAKPLPPEDLAHVLTHTRALWTEARGQSFFITGGTGFFGMWLLESFAHANDSLGLGAHATVLTRDPAAFAIKAPHLANRTDLTFIQGDVRTFTFPADRFGYIILAATEASAKLNAEAPHEMLDAIIGGTRRVLDFAAQAGVKKLLLTSSGAVYGRQPPDLSHIPEDYLGAPDPLLPGSAYGEGKRVSEHLCCVHARQHGYEVKIARCFAFVGPHLPLDAHFAIGNFIGDALAGRPIQVSGDGTPVRSYLYAADLAVWLWTILFRAPSARAYNVGGDEGHPISTIASRVAAAAKRPASAVTSPHPAAPATDGHAYLPLITRARTELGLRAVIPLDQAITRTLAWHHTH
jgi:nucleoside-diphosphate-sugar epimerase